MPRPRRPLRRPDGSPEHCTPDELLADAIAREDLSALPESGRPIDLSDYFASGPEHRMAGKLLRDNQVLPQALQERRDAEQHQAQATHYIGEQTARLASLRAQVPDHTQALSAPFSSRAALLDALGWQQWPNGLAEPTGAHIPSLRVWLCQVENVNEYLLAYNRQIETCIQHYRTLLEKADVCIERLNKQALFSRQLTPSPQRSRIDITAHVQRARRDLPPLQALPSDWRLRLTEYYQTAHPSVLRRLRALWPF